MRTGTFLALKMRNMQVWAAELLPEKDVIRRNKLLDKSVSELEATAVATSLKKHEAVVRCRDWAALKELLDGADVGTPDLEFWRDLILSLHSLPQSQDKFWRYLELFVDAVQ